MYPGLRGSAHGGGVEPDVWEESTLVIRHIPCAVLVGPSAEAILPSSEEVVLGVLSGQRVVTAGDVGGEYAI